MTLSWFRCDLPWLCYGFVMVSAMVCHGCGMALPWFAMAFAMDLPWFCYDLPWFWYGCAKVFVMGLPCLCYGLPWFSPWSCLGKFGVRGSSWRTRASEPLLVFELSLALEAPKTFGILRFFSHRAALPIADALANHESVHLEPNSGFRT